MQVDKINLSETGYFQSLFLDYINKKSTIKGFYANYPDPEGYDKIAKARKFPKDRRVKLFEELVRQYKDIEAPEPVLQNIQKLVNTNSYTITTGHQLNIFGGPLYFMYKIITVIRTCKILGENDPDHHFIPVFWMASEDHDFDEISSFRLFGKEYKWEAESKGPVGRLNPAGLMEIIHQLPERPSIFEEAYGRSHTLSSAVRYYVNAIFGQYGLVVIEPDSKELKAQFRDILFDELINQKASELVEETSKELTELGYKLQVNPREINLFYLHEDRRDRIIKEGDYYKMGDSGISFSMDEIIMELKTHPEKFSPNVVLRPLYQEMVLPNIGYVGGPAEIAYWLQLREVFNHYKVPFPVLIPRNFVLYLNEAASARLQKLGLRTQDLFLDVTQLKNKYMTEQSSNELNLEKETQILGELFESIKYKAISVDKSLEGLVGAEGAKCMKIFENIEKRILKAEEKNQEVSVRQLESLKDKLFPFGQLQERTDNFLNFYLNNPDFIKNITSVLDPFDFRFHIVLEETDSSMP